MIVEIYAVAYQYRDCDNRNTEAEPFTSWFLDKQKAQDICDEKNEEKMAVVRENNKYAAARKEKENREYEALVAAGLRESRERLKPFIQTQLYEPAVLVYAELENNKETA